MSIIKIKDYIFNNVVSFCILALSILAIWGSWDGVTTKLSINRLSFSSFVCILIISFFQILLVTALVKFITSFKDNKFLPAFCFFLVYFIIACLSVYFSYNFYYFRIGGASGHGIDIYSEKLSKIQNDIDNYKDKFTIAQNAMKNIADYSKETSEKESKDGGTCQDGNNVIGPGPRTQLRKDEADFFSKKAEEFDNKFITNSNNYISNLKNNIDNVDHIISNGSRKSEEDLNDIINKANNLNNQAKSWVNNKEFNERLEKNRNKLKVFYKKRFQEIRCPDNKIDDLIKDMQTAVNDLTHIEKIELFDFENQNVAMDRATDVFKTFFGIKVDKAPSNAEVTPIFLGIIVDIFIFLLKLADLSYYETGKVKSHFGEHINDNYEGDFFSAKQVDTIKNRYVLEKKKLNTNENPFTEQEMEHSNISLTAALGVFSSPYNTKWRRFFIPVNKLIINRDAQFNISWFEEIIKPNLYKSYKLYLTDISGKFLPLSIIRKNEISSFLGLNNIADICFTVYDIREQAWNEFCLLWNRDFQIDMTKEEYLKKLIDRCHSLENLVKNDVENLVNNQCLLEEKVKDNTLKYEYLKQEQQNFDSKINQKEILLNQLNKNHSNIIEELRRINVENNKYSALVNNYNKLHSQLQTTLSSYNEIDSQLHETEIKINQNTVDIEEILQTFNSIYKYKNDIEEKLKYFKQIYSSLLKSFSSTTNKISEIDNKINRNYNYFKNLYGDLKKITTQIDNYSGWLEKFINDNKDVKQIADALEESQSQLKKSQEELKEAHDNWYESLAVHKQKYTDEKWLIESILANIKSIDDLTLRMNEFESKNG